MAKTKGMRTPRWRYGRVGALLSLVLSVTAHSSPAAESASAASLSDSLSLELPDRGGELHPQGVLEIPDPQTISRAVFHIPAPRVFQVFSKVNAIGTGIVQTVRARQGEVVCELDLERHARRYGLGPGENTLELKIVPEAGSEPIHASWVLVPSGEALGWEEFAQGASSGERPTTRPEEFAGEKWAVVIGISDYRHDAQIGDLRFAHRDAQAVRDFLVSPAGGEFRPERVMLLTDEQATNQEIRTALFSFLAETQREDLVLIFFAGHGFADPKNTENFFFAAHDSEYHNLGGTALPMWDLQSVMDFTIRARRVVVLADACHSGALVRRPDARGVKPINLFSKYLQALGREEGRLVLTASRVYEPSQERPDWGGGHGVFTYSVLRGLKGEADVDSDGVVTAGELLDYLRFVVPRETRGEQHPEVQEAGFNRSFPLASVEVRTAGR